VKSVQTCGKPRFLRLPFGEQLLRTYLDVLIAFDLSGDFTLGVDAQFPVLTPFFP